MAENKQINKNALKVLKAQRKRLTRQQFKTLKGQILAGDDLGALKGLIKILNRKDTDA